jgi:mRNA-degrading endonuclease RelE of RelBE toxin-antitoxin system
VNYRYRATPQFWKNFHTLSAAQKDLAREKFRIFHENPFDPRLRTHKIQSLSSLFKRTIHAVVIEGNLRAVFYIEDDLVVTFNIGTHDIYKT